MHYSSGAVRGMLLTGALMIGGCSAPDGPIVLKDPDKIITTQNELGAATFDLSRVVVVRVKIDDETREVTSLLPVIVAEVRMPDGLARTIFRVEQKTDTLTLFTRDGQSKVAYRVDVPVKDRAARPSVIFPVLDKTGKVVQRKISVEAVFAK